MEYIPSQPTLSWAITASSNLTPPGSLSSALLLCLVPGWWDFCSHTPGGQTEAQRGMVPQIWIRKSKMSRVRPALRDKPLQGRGGIHGQDILVRVLFPHP